MRASVATICVLMLAAGAALSGCNTVSGMGEDLSAAGRGIDQTSEATQDKMTGEQRTQQQRDQDYQSGRY